NAARSNHGAIEAVSVISCNDEDEAILLAKLLQRLQLWKHAWNQKPEHGDTGLRLLILTVAQHFIKFVKENDGLPEEKELLEQRPGFLLALLDALFYEVTGCNGD